MSWYSGESIDQLAADTLDLITCTASDTHTDAHGHDWDGTMTAWLVILTMQIPPNTTLHYILAE
jgi:hypothetical protein